MIAKFLSSLKTLKSQVIIITGVLVLTVAYSLFQKKLYVLPLTSQREVTVKIPHFKLKDLATSDFLTQNHFFINQADKGQLASITDAASSAQSSSSSISFNSGSKPVLMHFWATWCIPCVEELPLLLKFAKDPLWKDQFHFIIVATQDTEAKVRKFLDNLSSSAASASNTGHEANISMLIDPDGALLEQLGGYKLPETYILTQEGFSKQFSGPQDWSSSRFGRELKAYVAKSDV